MTLSEVRYGNQVLIMGKTQTVYSIVSSFSKTINGYVEDDVTGIHLTAEWLEKAGFKRGDNVTSNDSFYVIKCGASEFAINPDNGVVWITNPKGESFNNPALIEHVHTLQNIMYALTGKELTFN